MSGHLGFCSDEISATQGAFAGALSQDDEFGIALARLGDLDGDLRLDLAAGERNGSDGASGAGVLWAPFLDGAPVTPPASASPYGCGVNPAGSLVVGSGPPAVGTTLVLRPEDPTGAVVPVAASFLALAAFPAPGFPCGTPMPGWKLGGALAAGELLVALLPVPETLTGPSYFGPPPLAQPTSALNVPVTTGLLGQSVFAQDALFEPMTGVGLTNGLELVIGP